jgi:hypothetical protein
MRGFLQGRHGNLVFWGAKTRRLLLIAFNDNEVVSMNNLREILDSLKRMGFVIAGMGKAF